MAKPLIEEIEACKQDIAQYRADLEEIIAEADADGVRDDDEKEEIKTFEDSIADLEKFVDEKQAEFDKNKAEWEGLSGKISELMNDFQTLTDWGEPQLPVVDQIITTMDTQANSLFFRDAITSYETAQSAIDPLMEEYNKQSAAKLTYEEDLEAAKQRVDACRQSEYLDAEIEASLNQYETDFTSTDILGEQRDYVNALSTLQMTVEDIGRTEEKILENEQAKKDVIASYVETVSSYNDARDAATPYEDLLKQLEGDFTDAVEKFNTSLEANDFDQAGLILEQAEASIAYALEQVPIREAAAAEEQKRLEEQEALLEKEREQLAADLSAAPPQGTAWILYEWQDGDSFDSLAKTSKVANADVLLGHPNNKKLSEHFKIEKDLPSGTLVAIMDPTVVLYEIEFEGTTYFLTKSELDQVTSGNQKMMKEAALNYRSLFTHLAKNHQAASDARHMVPLLTEFMSGIFNFEPTSEKSAAESLVKKLEGSANANDGEQFTQLVTETAEACDVYQDALIEWLAEMQTSLSRFMAGLSFADTVAKATATFCVVAIAAPVGVVGVAAWTAGTGAGLSALSDAGHNAAAWKLDMPMFSAEEIKARAAWAFVTSGSAALLFGGIFAVAGKPFVSQISKVTVAAPTWRTPCANFINKILPNNSLVTEGMKSEVIILCKETFQYRVSAAFLKKTLMPYIESCLFDNPEIALAKTPEAAAFQICEVVVTDEFRLGFFEQLYQEHKTDIEAFLTAECERLEEQAE